ncbi:uridine diphosphate-N-acetylglucosamine-binding protein YvcK [Cetobacterium sp. 2A]|uniref:gluconeogenesis factor YvcK family protein n=1 Tax=unclassified Cetobacterium TaxID=2630983 RepID=UPI00163C39B7|nr:uridine diphosphate-N-acetylglucosamine-binding protein YvcK [Cetobacterium sp. 2A]MBC2855046.1 uridine diphosphate-N-acetylglucosamine-binding protein YvcK [Cetobacterium sp. 2A]
MKRPRVVVIGGGSGLSVVLKGLKHFPIDITAIVTVADNGGSSGILRKEFNIPAPGDLRNVMVALSDVEPLIEEVFQHRFKEDSFVGGHPLGNLLITAMIEITGDIRKAIEKLRKLFNIKGKILPATLENVELIAEKCSGEIVLGETNIPVAGEKIKRVFYSSNFTTPEENLREVEKADLIIFGIGSLYTSLIPNFLSHEMQEALKSSKGKKIYICNAMQQPGETEGYTVGNHIESINRHVGYNMVEKVIFDSREIPDKILKRYREEGSDIVKLDKDNLELLGVELIEANIIQVDKKNQIRHHPYKLAATIYSQIENLDNFYI